MSDQRIILSFTPSGLNLVALRRNMGVKGIVLASAVRLVDGKWPKPMMERLDRFDSARKSEVILVLPVRQIALKYLRLPSKNPDELRRMADLQAFQGLPFAAEEMVSAAVIGDTDTDGYTRVIIALARRTTVQKSMDAAAALKLVPTRCAVSAFGVAQWHAKRFPGDAGQLVLVADVREDGFELCFCKNRKLLFARGVLFSDGDSVVRDALVQVQLTFQAFAREIGSEEPAKIILIGVKEKTNNLKEVLARVSSASITETDVGEDLPGELLKNSDFVSPGAAVLGMALAIDTGPDITPIAIHKARMDNRLNISLLRLGAAVILLAGALALLVNLRLFRQEESLAVLRKQVSETKKLAQEAKRRIQLFEFIRQNNTKPVGIAQLVHELYRVVPQSTALINLQLMDETLTIQGLSRESSDVGVIQKAMLDSSFFKDVTLQYANRPQRFAMEYTEFKILCRVTKMGENGS